MEVEVRFYFPLSEYQAIVDRLAQHTDLTDYGSSYEKTLLFDNPNPAFSFYSKEIDGRFRVRMTKHTAKDEKNSKISWKRRLGKTASGIHTEEEVEIKIQYDECEKLIYLLTDVIRMNRIESYERYRHVFANDDIEIAIDKFPFGIALEIELKEDNASDDLLLNWVGKIGLDMKDSYKLSCDDKYRELCLASGRTPKKDILFDDPDMPSLAA